MNSGHPDKNIGGNVEDIFQVTMDKEIFDELDTGMQIKIASDNLKIRVNNYLINQLSGVDTVKDFNEKTKSIMVFLKNNE